jgi:hypothetical protein
MLGGIHGLVLKVSALYHHPFAAITNALTGRVPAILLGFASDVSGVIGAEVAVVVCLYNNNNNASGPPPNPVTP